ncbi:unnamed protein product [Urochloa humidicola]
MDSGNSGSLQSSSGGDDEFDSRAGGGVDSSPLSALLRSSPSPSAGAFSLHGSYFGLQEFTSAPPPQQPQQQQAGAWSGSFAGASSSSPRLPHADAGASRPQVADTASAAAQGQVGGVSAPAQPAPSQPPRGSRKRTRASRRAPTTVLTTDTSNFRAMVQEFTGIPSPPFGAGVAGVGLGGPTASLRTRFDHIFPPPSTSLRTGAAADAASLPPYLLRPFPHKLPTAPSSFPPFTSSSSSSTPSSSNIGAGAANANAATGTATNTAAAASSNPATPAAAGDTFQQLMTPSALLRLQQDASSYLSFQNLLDTHPSSQSIFGPAAAGGFAQAPPSRLHDPSPSPSDFLAGVGGSSHSLGLGAHGGLLGSEGPMHLHHSRSSDAHGHGGDELSGVVAAGASGGGGSCKLNYSSHAGAGASSSAAAGADNKPPDGGGPGRAGRGDGLDPWICTSE